MASQWHRPDRGVPGHKIIGRQAVLAMAAIAAGVGLCACESPFADRTDSDAYRLIAERQRAALGAQTDDRIGAGESPLQASDRMTQRVPLTVNEILPNAGVPATAPAPGTAPAPAATQDASTKPSIDALLANLPGVDLSKMPELPVFPRPTVNGKVRRLLNLDDAFNEALASNRDYKSRKEDLYLAALNVGLQRHVFEPQAFATSTVGMSGGGEVLTRPAAGTRPAGEYNDYSVALNATQSVGVQQNLPTGGQLIAQVLASTVQEIRQSVATSDANNVALSASIPLLRGAGTVAQEDLIAAERSMVYQVRDFERYRRGFLVTVASQYFSLVNQRAQIVNRFSNVRSYIFITDRSKALFEAGLTARRTTLLDVMRAAQAEYQARSSLIGAIQQYELALDQFKLLLGIPVEQPIDVAPQYLTIAPPTLSEAQAIAIALRLRLDLQSVRDRVEDSRRGVKNAGNDMLPDVNLNASVGAGSNAGSFQPRYENLNYNTNLTVNWPLDRVPQENALRAAQVGLDRAKRSVETAEQQVVTDVRSSLRAVQQQQIVLAIQKSNIELAQKRKEFSDIQFRDGKIDNRDYLDAETALLDAQNSFAKALSDLEVSVLQYLRDTDQLRVDFNGKLVLPTGVEAQPAATTASPVTTATSSPATQPDFLRIPRETQPGTQGH